jgi:hypothetical protein
MQGQEGGSQPGRRLPHVCLRILREHRGAGSLNRFVRYRPGPAGPLACRTDLPGLVARAQEPPPIASSTERPEPRKELVGQLTVRAHRLEAVDVLVAHHRLMHRQMPPVRLARGPAGVTHWLRGAIGAGTARALITPHPVRHEIPPFRERPCAGALRAPPAVLHVRTTPRLPGAASATFDFLEGARRFGCPRIRPLPRRARGLCRVP